jgi:hypothetical protein
MGDSSLLGIEQPLQSQHLENHWLENLWDKSAPDSCADWLRRTGDSNVSDAADYKATPVFWSLEPVWDVDKNGGRYRIRTYDFHRVKMALYR